MTLFVKLILDSIIKISDKGKGIISNIHPAETQHEDAICRVTKEGLNEGPIPDPPFDGLTCQEALNLFSSLRGFFFFNC